MCAKEQEHMDNNKNMVQETGRWLRVTVLALTTLGPLINALAERLRERTQALRETTGQLDLAEQSSNLTQKVASRSSKATQSLAERGSKASQELVKRGGELTHQVKQRSQQVKEQL